MIIHMLFLLLATAGVALREAGEAGEASSKSVGEAKSIEQRRDAAWNATEFGDSSAFTMILTLEVPPENMDDFNKMQVETSKGYQKDLPGIFMFHAFTSETEPNRVAVIQVFADRNNFLAHMKTSGYANWLNVSQNLRVDVVSCTFLGDPELPEEVKKDVAGGNASYWPQTTGFARRPHSQKNHGKTWVIQAIFQVPNDNLPTINVLNTAFIATQFDWDPTCFFARVCLDQAYVGDETRFSYGGVYLMGHRPWSRAVEFGEGKSEENWLATAAQYGVQLLKQNIYGEVSPNFRVRSRKFASQKTTFWDFAYGYDQYKTDRYLD